jgi:hypothetical protein
MFPREKTTPGANLAAIFPLKRVNSALSRRASCRARKAKPAMIAAACNRRRQMVLVFRRRKA